MKKIDKVYSKEYLPVFLCLDDLEEIEQIIKTADREVIIKDGDCSYESVGDLYNHREGQTINKLTFQSHTPYIELEFWPLWTKLYVSSEDGLKQYYKLNELLKKKQRRITFGYSLLFLIAFPFTSPILNHVFSENSVVKIVFNTAIIIWFAWALYVRLLKFSTIVVQKGNQRQSFLKRNGDNLIIALISAVAGALVSGVVTYYLSRS